MTALQAHLICIVLVAVDLLARAWRIQWIVQGFGHQMSVKDAFVLNAFGDAACALTPLRIGGEPARLAGMLPGRGPPTAAFVGISLGGLSARAVLIISAALVGWGDGPGLWARVGAPPPAAAGQG